MPEIVRASSKNNSVIRSRGQFKSKSLMSKEKSQKDLKPVIVAQEVKNVEKPKKDDKFGVIYLDLHRILYENG